MSMEFASKNRNLRQKMSSLKFRMIKQSRRFCAVLICISLTLGGFPSAFFQAFATEDNDEYVYELDLMDIYDAIVTAVDEATTLDKELKFSGDYAESYDELFDPDGTLYELKDLKVEKDRNRDKNLALRVFVRIEGDINLDEEYEIAGSEPLIFLLTNKTDEEVNAVIQVDDYETEAISILPADSVINSISEDITEAEVVSEESLNGNSRTGNATGAVETDNKTEVNIEIDDVENSDEDVADIDGSADSDDNAADSDDDAADLNDDVANSVNEDIEDSDARIQNKGNIAEDKKDTTNDNNSSHNQKNVERTDKKDIEKQNKTDSDKKDNSKEDSDNKAEDNGEKNNASDKAAAENKEASVSEHKMSRVKAALNDDDAKTEADVASASDASPSNVDKLINGTVYDSVLLDNKGTVAFITTLENIGLDLIKLSSLSLTWEGKDYTVTVYFSRSSSIPEDVELEVTEYLSDTDEYIECYEEAAELYEWGESSDGTRKVTRNATGIDFHLLNISLISSEGEMDESLFTRGRDIVVTITYPDQDEEVEYTITSFSQNQAENKETESAYEEGVQSITFETHELGDFGIALLRAADINTYEALVATIEDAIGDTELALQADMKATDTHIIVPEDANIILDLNGFVLMADDSNPDALFTIPSGATLTIKDSQQSKVIKDNGEVVTVTGAGQLAETTKDTDGTVTLTYYVTESEVTDYSCGYTQETRYEYTVTSAGMITTSGNHALFNVKGGTLNINSGFFYGSEPETGDVVNSRAIDADNGADVNLRGGYICGFYEGYSSGHSEDFDGGAVRVSGSGTILGIYDDVVLADNKAATGGAVDVANGAVLNMTGGVISGNEAQEDTYTYETQTDYGGGGIHVYEATANISGGYITNNVSDCSGYFDGGGGILVWGSTLNLSGGYITGNKAASSGGGIRTAYGGWNKAAAGTVNITGGYICANYAVSAEGGGVCIDNGGYCSIVAEESIYINNNETGTDVHWGGGGLFCANGATTYMEDIIVTENSAGGFGGGVAGCSTGRIAIAEGAGAAIYANAAEGMNLSGSGSEKNEDHTYGSENEIFMRYGYQDYFCALESQVSGTLLGGGSANWSGSADGVVVSNVGAGEILHATNIMGLTAKPSDDDIVSAQNNAKVYFTGNSSNTHGGGMLSNGYLVIGTVIKYEMGDALELDADKFLINSANGEQLDIGEYKFTITVTDGLGAEVSKGTVQEDGNILFDRRLSFDSAGTFTFTIKEDASENVSVLVDTSIYMLVVTVSEREGEITLEDQIADVDYIWYYITNYTLYKDDEEILTNQIEEPSIDSVVHLTIPSPAFTNYITDKISITVVKEWNDDDDAHDSITATLYQNGTVYATDENPDIGSVILSDDSNWTYTWHDLPIDDGNGNLYFYEVKETVPDGYVYSTEITNSSSEENISYWVPLSETDAKNLETGAQYLIVYGNVALGQRPGQEDNQFGTEDPIRIAVNQSGLTLGNSNYTSYIEDSEVQTHSGNNIIWMAVSDSKGQLIKNYNLNSWLLVQGTEGAYLKGTNAAAYASDFKFSGENNNYYLMGSNGYYVTEEYRYIVYQNGRFDSSMSATDAAIVYVKLTPVTTSTTVTIINTKVEDAKFILNIAKEDAGDSNIMLEGAKFQLLKEGEEEQTDEILSFIPSETTAGLYEYSDSQTSESTTELVTAGTYGRLSITGLPVGNYILRETEAPTGYICADDIHVEMGSNNDGSTTIYLTVKDEREALALPKTGGLGTYPFRVVGLLMLANTLYLLYIAIKRKRRRQKA